MDLARARASQASQLIINLDMRDHVLDVTGFKALLRQQVDEEGLGVTVHAQIKGACADIKLGVDWRVVPSDDLLSNLRRLAAVSSVEMV